MVGKSCQMHRSYASYAMTLDIENIDQNDTIKIHICNFSHLICNLSFSFFLQYQDGVRHNRTEQ